MSTLTDSAKSLFAGCSKRSRGEACEKATRRDGRDRPLPALRCSEAIERNEAYESFSGAYQFDKFSSRT